MKVPNVVALGRWVNPMLWALGALVLIGYLMIGDPGTTVMANLASASAAHDAPARSSMTNVLNAAVGTVLAAGWLIGSAWIGIRSARVSLD